MSNNWVQYPSTSNLLKKTYIKDFLDVSGEMYMRNGSMNVSGNINATGDLICKNVSLASGALDSGINSDVQTALDGKQATLTAGSNITINGSTISSSASGGGLTGISEDTNYNDWEIKGAPIYGKVAYDHAGKYVSMSGDGTRVLLTVGGGSGGDGWNSAARVYEYTNNSWTQMGSDLPTFIHYSHSYGGSVMSNDGSTIALCSPWGPDSMIRVFTWNGSSWVQRGANLYGNHTDSSNFGVDAALNHDGTVLAAGERKTRDAWWYKWNGSSWDLRVVIPDSGTMTSELLRENGLSLDSTGNRLAFATRAFSNSLGNYVGHARVFDWDENTSTSSQVGSEITGDTQDDRMQSISITGDGSTIVIGSTYDEGVGNIASAATNSGSVKVYKYINNDWVKQGSTLYGYEESDQMGWSVDINEDGTIIASASWYYLNPRAHIWKWDGSDWQSYGSDILPENYNSGGQTINTWTETGLSLSLSNDGNTIAVGEWRQDTNTETNVYTVDQGRVRILNREASALIKMDGNVIVNGDLDVTRNIIVNGATVHTSDDRLKVNEVKIEKGLEYINQLTPQIYDKKEAFDINISKKDSGLIAQDIWYKTPELRHLVKTPEAWKIQHMELGDTINPDPSYNEYGWSNETPAAVNYIGVIAYLVKSIQELNSKYIENESLIENYKASKNT